MRRRARTRAAAGSLSRQPIELLARVVIVNAPAQVGAVQVVGAVLDPPQVAGVVESEPHLVAEAVRPNLSGEEIGRRGDRRRAHLRGIKAAQARAKRVGVDVNKLIELNRSAYRGLVADARLIVRATPFA